MKRRMEGSGEGEAVFHRLAKMSVGAKSRGGIALYRLIRSAKSINLQFGSGGAGSAALAGLFVAPIVGMILSRMKSIGADSRRPQ